MKPSTTKTKTKMNQAEKKPSFAKCYHTIALELGILESYVYSIISTLEMKYPDKGCYLTDKGFSEQMMMSHSSYKVGADGKKHLVLTTKPISSTVVSFLIKNLADNGWILKETNFVNNKKQRTLRISKKKPIAEFTKKEIKSKSPSLKSSPFDEEKYERTLKSPNLMLVE